MAILTVPAIALISLSLYSIYRLIIYPTFICSLSKIPCAHWSSRISPIWILWTRFSERENRQLLRAHQRYGPILRIAPNELSINDLETLRAVYTGGFEKGPWYSFFDNYNVPCTFSSLSSRQHSARKRMHSATYSKSYIQGSPAALRQAVIILNNRLLAYLNGACLRPDDCTPTINVLELWNATMMDFITAYLFGLKGCYNFLEDINYRQKWLSMFHCRKPYSFFAQELPQLTHLLQTLGIRLIPQWVDDMNEQLETFTKQSCEVTRLFLSEQNAGHSVVQPSNEPVVFKAIQSGIEKEAYLKGASSVLANETLLTPDLSIASEMIDHLAAGQETSGITLTYLSWHLSQDLGLQDALRKELLSLSPNFLLVSDVNESKSPDPKDLDTLPLLNAILMETLRLNAAIPGSQPRMTPYPSCSVGPYIGIPGGIRISARAHNLHRNAEVFVEPESWNYRRWMDHENGMSEEKQRERERWFWAFGSGGRMCVGKNFALHSMKMTIAAVYTNFRSHIVDDEGIEQTDGWTCGPRSNKLMLKFEKVGEAP